MKNFFYTIIIFTVLNSCSEYQKVLKFDGEGAIAKKFKMGETLYNAGSFSKANKLFAQIVPSYRGKPQAEKLMYLYSNTFYKMKDYYVASYQFDRFASNYPKSEKLEETTFLSAKSHYQLSPTYSIEQKETKKAIEKFQEFINLFPESEYIPEANTLVQELDFKLEKKAYEIAKQYNKISDYPAALKSFDNFIFEFPGSKLREKALFYRLDSAYRLAINSIEYKRIKQQGLVHLKKQRLETAKEYLKAFKQTYSKSEYIKDVDEMASDIDNTLKNYSTKS